jgi:glycosyltransferase involved in cell wall biosynthesis
VKVFKVCHIISGDLWAGAEVVTYNLFKGLLKHQDIESSTIVLNEGRLSEEIRGLGIPVYVVNEREKSFLSLVSSIREVIRKMRPDVIHSHRYKENILAYIASRTKNGIRLISTQHGMPEVYGEKKNLRHRSISSMNFFLLSKCFHAVVAVSRDIQGILVTEYGFQNDRIRMIHNGIEIPKDPPAGREKGVFVIGSSGRLFPVKDYPLMVEVAKEVLKRIEEARFELIGDGPEMVKITALVKRYGLEKSFLLRGFEDSTSSFYSGIDIYLNTSVHEGIPMSVLEAMSHGIPVIAPKVGGLMEIIDEGVNGYLVEGRNAKDFAKRCVSLHENDMLRRRMGSAAQRKVASEFSMEHMAQRYYNLYMEEIKTHNH